MIPRVVKKTIAEPKLSKRAASTAYDLFETHVFDTATVFVVSGYEGRGKIYRAEFATLQEAIEHHAVAPCRCCVRAVNAAGRCIVLDRKDWPKWLERLEEKNRV